MESKNKPKILLVEDDPLLLKMYSTKFETEGFQVFTAADGEEGLTSMTVNKPDCVILDVMMPKVSGIDMLDQYIKAHGPLTIPVIILSNLSQEDEAKKALALGAKEYLIKANFTPSEVVSKVRLYLVKQ